MDWQEVIHSIKINFSNEAECHRGIKEAFDAAGIAYQHEVKIPEGRLDFLIDGVGVEVKLDGSLSDLTRQLYKYSLSSKLTGLAVITNKNRLTYLPLEMSEKPLEVIFLSGNVF